MTKLRKQEQAAIEAVARHFSAHWEESHDTSGACLSIDGKKIAIEVATLRQRIEGRTAVPKPRLRLDRTVHAVITRLQARLRESVPDGATVIFTLTAPIRLPAKTVESLEDIIRPCLARRATNIRRKDTVHGNKIQVWVVRSGSLRTSKVVGLVHNPDTDPDMLLHMTQSLLQRIGAAADAHRSASRQERWLVLIMAGGNPHVGIYQQVYRQLSLPTDFSRILLVFTGGRVATLT
jgi:hypothetical protein